jgi:hypothetical protein
MDTDKSFEYGNIIVILNNVFYNGDLWHSIFQFFYIKYEIQ